MLSKYVRAFSMQANAKLEEVFGGVCVGMMREK